MNLLSTNIIVNCQRFKYAYYELFDYLWTIIPYEGSIHSSIKNQFHSLVYTGGWFFYSGHWGNYFKSIRHIFRFFLSPMPFYWFRVSEGGLRYAHKTPVLAEFQDKNGTPENPPQCMQCPEPDNMRPCKAIFCFIGGYPVGNSGLSLGRLVHCTGKCWSVVALGFYREVGAITKK